MTRRSFADYKLVASRFRVDSSLGKLFHIDGRRAGYVACDGYRYVSMFRKVFLEHRLIWFMSQMEVPDQIDHINMIRDDNRLLNLRNSTSAENTRNRPVQSNNALGAKGVTFRKSTGRYCARITHNKCRIVLGYFDTKEEASKAYQAAAKEHHGLFARF